MEKYPKRGKFEPFASRQRGDFKLPGLQPELRILLRHLTRTAVVAGFDSFRVQREAFKLITRGWVPVEEDYTLYQHKITKQTGHFRKITLIKKTT